MTDGLGYVVAMETDSPQPDCTRCKELEKQVAELAAQVKRLASKLESKTRQSKRSAAPQRVRPSRKKPPEEHLKSGRPKGHDPASKPTPEKIDRVIEVPAIPCPDCKCELTMWLSNQSCRAFGSSFSESAIAVSRKLAWIGVGKSHCIATPLPPNRTGGSPASGSPVDS